MVSEFENGQNRVRINTNPYYTKGLDRVLRGLGVRGYWGGVKTIGHGDAETRRHGNAGRKIRAVCV